MANKPARRPQSRSKLFSGDIALISIIGVIVIALAFVYQSFNTDGFKLDTTTAAEGSGAVAEIYAADIIRINEIMSANDSAYYTEDGETSDWLEITNTGASPVNLMGYTLAKKASGTDQFVFPSVELGAGECVVVFCDKKSRNTAGYEFHAPFGISRAGDVVMLFNPAGTAVDTVNVPDLENNISYSRIDDTSWEKTEMYTPGLPNTEESHRSFTDVMIQSPIVVNEIMAKNATYAPDSAGLYSDYIELYNTSDSAIDLTGYHLSDSRDNVMKWTFPEGTVIQGGGYLLVYASGLNKAENGEIHTSFKLSTEGEVVCLANAKGQLFQIVDYGLLKADEAYSRNSDGTYTNKLPPTPGLANTTDSAALISDRFAAQNGIGVFINEIAASTSEAKYDWVELYNNSSVDVDLSGYGLSDATDKPRKWQFPNGTVISAGGYLGVYMSGLSDIGNGQLSADYKLSADGGYTLCLATSEGKVFDRVYVPQQFSNITYGRLPGQFGACYYFTTSSAMKANGGNFYARKASEARYSMQGGMYETGTTLTVELTCDPGDRIYYTTNFDEPTQNSTLYTGPLTISSNTVLRTRVYADDALESYMSCQTYLFGAAHSVKLISLVSSSYNLISDEAGIMVKGPNALSEYPYGSMNKGANFWMDWERDAHIEIYDADGTSLVSQECGIKLHGQYSRAEAQKAFKVYARSKYSGDNRFVAALFGNRDYTEYKSFLLRSSGQDCDKTRMRDSVLTSLAADTSVYYQETEVCVVYINGVYWGQYNMREHINAASICQFEGWEGQEDDIDIVKANTNTMQGSNDSFAKLIEWVKSNDTTAESAYDKIGSAIDIQNYIEYMAVEIFTGNTDTLNVKRYRNANDDGKWRWALFDLDWAFTVDTDSIGRWLKSGGMGNGKRTDNTLFIACMKNKRFREEFLTYFGQQLATTFSTQNIENLVNARRAILEPELQMQADKWGPTLSKYKDEVKFFMDYAESRPTKLLGYFKSALKLSNDQMQQYFGDAYQAIQDYKNAGA